MHRKIIPAIMLVICSSVLSQLKINEIMPKNVSAVWDDAYNYSMWVELYNTSPTAGYSQALYYLTDNLSEPQKWKPVYKIVPAKGYTVLWFEHDNIFGHANFKLEPDGGKLYLVNEQKTAVDSVIYPAQYRNVSYGRVTDGADRWVFFEQSSPGTTNNNKKNTPIQCEKPTLTLNPGFYSSAQQVGFNTIISTDTIYYSTDGSEPQRTHFRYIPGSKISLTKTTVVRARIFSGTKLPGDITTGTYFINERNFSLPVVSISTTPANLSDNTIGIYVQGTNGITGNGMDTPANWNQDWDRPVNFELFDRNKTQQLSQEVDVNIAGGWTRMNGQKSLKINPKKKFGNNLLNYDFFAATKPRMKYKSILLRNSGNDFYYSMLRDGYMNELVRNRMNIDYIAYEPAICFMNGVYYGIQNIRERSDVDYIYSNYGLDEDKIKLLESWEQNSDTSYTRVSNYIAGTDVTNSNVYANIGTMIDLESFINYHLTQIYYGNTDWPHNNNKIWKKRDNGKWRWILYDTDFGFSLYNTTLYNHNTLLHALSEVSTDPPASWSTIVLKRLLMNDTFKKRFVSSFCIHMSSTFNENRANAILDSMATRIATEINYHKTKWPSYRAFSTDIANMKTFSANRPIYMMNFLSSRLMASATPKIINISSNHTKASYTFNDVVISDANINLRYFNNQDITLKANNVPGFRFKNWEIGSSSAASTIFDYGSSFKYNDGNALPASNWNTNNYSDSNWKTGIAPLGYGNTSVATIIGYGGVATNKYTTAYFRKTFQLSQLSSKTDFQITTQFDDGIVLYVNGTEIGRNNMPAGTILHSTLASTYAENNAQSATFTIPQNLLTEGTNVIAVEVHQNSVTSSDLLLNMKLTCNASGSVTTNTNAVLSTNTSQINSLKAIYEQSVFEDPEKDIKVYINEIVAENTRNTDERGNYDDYLEIYNGGNSPVNIAGWYITDIPSERRLWRIPDTDSAKTAIPANGRIIIWADEEQDEGILHAGFKLSKSGETIVMSKLNYLGDLVKVDSVSYGYFPTDMSYSRVPDGAANWVIQKSTWNATNNLTATTDDSALADTYIYPTMSVDKIHAINAAGQAYYIADMTGKLVSNGIFATTNEEISIASLRKGVYLLKTNHRVFKIIRL